MKLEVEATRPGRALHVDGEGTLYLSHRYAVLCSRDDGASWERLTSVPGAPLGWMTTPSRLASRLMRHEVKALVRLADGGLVASTRRGVHHGRPGEPLMRPSRVETRGEAVMPPMTLTVGPGDRVIWGEYGSKRGKRGVRLYASDDAGSSFRIVYAFDPGEVLHVHNVLHDPARGHYWVLAGDHGDEPGIGILSEDLAKFEWLAKGEQLYRAVEAFDFGDRLVYATDTEMERNALVSMDKDSGRTERLMELEGSCIHACRFGDIYAFSTTVEPSPVNPTRSASLWVSRDGERWDCVLEARKDRWNGSYFQFGSLVLPRGRSGRERLFLSGQAVEGLAGLALVAQLAGPG
jgi:hypothetical protein